MRTRGRGRHGGRLARQDDCVSSTLEGLAGGQEAEVVSVPTNPDLLRKLSAFGILPGARVMMLQRSPTFVVRIGFTDVALGKEIASLVGVKPLGREE